MLGWLPKMPIVSLCLAAAIVGVPLEPEMSPGAFADEFEDSREAARSYLLRNPGRNYFAHAFVQEEWVGVILCLLVLVLAGVPLERTWGHTIFTVFTVAAIPGVAEADRLLDGSSRIPWSGDSGLAAASLGAYFIRGLGGHFVIPGWIFLSLWLAAESFVVRGFWLEDFGSALRSTGA